MIKNGNIVISQSTTKELGLFVIDDQLYNMDSCMKRFYHKYVAKDYVYDEIVGAPAPMEIGLYGESLTLGGSARGSFTSDLRRKKNGTKYVDQERVEIMAQRMYGYMYAHGARWGFNNTQVPLIAEYKPHIWVKGEYDVFPTKWDGRLATLDTKFTKDVDNFFSSMSEKNIRHSTLSCWGGDKIDPSDKHSVAKDLNKAQPLFYHFIARHFERTGLENLMRFNKDKASIYQYLFSQKNDYTDMDFIFVVAGYGKSDMRHQLNHFHYNMNSQRETLFEYLVDSAVEKIRTGMENDFEANPKPHLCKKCSLRDVCLGKSTT